MGDKEITTQRGRGWEEGREREIDFKELAHPITEAW